MIPLHISFIVLMLSVTNSYVLGTSIQFRSNQDIDGKLPNTIQTINSLNLLHCSRLCTEDVTCYSFFHIKQPDSNCVLLDTIITSVDGLTSAPAASYFTLYGAPSPVTTTAATTTTAAAATTGTSTPVPLLTLSPAPSSSSNAPCPDIYQYLTVLLTDNTTFTYKVSRNSATMHDGPTTCSGEGGFMVRVNSVAKLQYLTSVLTHCQVSYLKTTYIRVDGFNGYNDSIWLYSNGQQAPMGPDLWSADSPIIPHARHCLVLNINDKIQDYNCADTADTYVCEK